MPIYLIYVGDKPLTWDADDQTNHAMGEEVTCFFAFRDKPMAERIMATIPGLFAMEDEEAEKLHVVEATIPG